MQNVQPANMLTMLTSLVGLIFTMLTVLVPHVSMLTFVSLRLVGMS